MYIYMLHTYMYIYMLHTYSHIYIYIYIYPDTYVRIYT